MSTVQCLKVHRMGRAARFLAYHHEQLCLNIFRQNNVDAFKPFIATVIPIHKSSMCPQENEATDAGMCYAKSVAGIIPYESH